MRAAWRKDLESRVWKDTHADARSKSGATRSILVLRHGATTLVPMSELTDDELISRASRTRLEEETRAWRDATKDTTTKRIWASQVRLAAILKGASASALESARVQQILSRAFTHGEPVWMAADEVAFVAKESSKKLAPTVLDEIRSARAISLRKLSEVEKEVEKGR